MLPGRGHGAEDMMPRGWVQALCGPGRATSLLPTSSVFLGGGWSPSSLAFWQGICSSFPQTGFRTVGGWEPSEKESGRPGWPEAWSVAAPPALLSTAGLRTAGAEAQPRREGARPGRGPVQGQAPGRSTPGWVSRRAQTENSGPDGRGWVARPLTSLGPFSSPWV